jgi:hypothetical protein
LETVCFRKVEVRFPALKDVCSNSDMGIVVKKGNNDSLAPVSFVVICTKPLIFFSVYVHNKKVAGTNYQLRTSIYQSFCQNSLPTWVNYKQPFS